MSRVRITFWGVRGSVAAPGRQTKIYGGNTACLEIDTGRELIVCDAGTGIRGLGVSLLRRYKKRPISASIILTHMHWDHYIGLPFFGPLYDPRNSFLVGGPKEGRMPFGEALSRAMQPPYFPVPFSALPARVVFKTIAERQFSIGGVRIKPMAVNHPGGAFGWRFFFRNGRSVVHVTDNEPATVDGANKLARWMKGADVLIHDAQYSPKSYEEHRGWGHSPFTYPISLAARAGIKKVFLFHFDPSDNDVYLKRVIGVARVYAKSLRADLRCELAREGLSIKL